MYITGDNYKLICDFIYDENGFRKTNIINDIPIYFVKTDFVDDFFKKLLPKNYFKLITHNSDIPITKHHKKYLTNKYLIKWFSQNVDFDDVKLVSIPIGIANSIWEHGNTDILDSQISSDSIKTNLVYCNFNPETNLIERNKCLKSIYKNKLIFSKAINFNNYLSELKKSYFCLSPNGNGIDCHKTWEALYLKTIPVVTNSININFYRNFPILIIDNWETFDSGILNIDLYNNIMSNSKFDICTMDDILMKIKIAI